MKILFGVLNILTLDQAVRQFAIFPSTKYKVNENDQFSIKCQAAKDTYSTIILETNGTVVQFDTSQDDKLHVVFYEVTYAEMSQSGTYKCKATLKKLDTTMERSVKVIVKGLESNFSVWNHILCF